MAGCPDQADCMLSRFQSRRQDRALAFTHQARPNLRFASGSRAIGFNSEDSLSTRRRKSSSSRSDSAADLRSAHPRSISLCPGVSIPHLGPFEAFEEPRGHLGALPFGKKQRLVDQLSIVLACCLV